MIDIGVVSGLGSSQRVWLWAPGTWMRVHTLLTEHARARGCALARPPGSRQTVSKAIVPIYLPTPAHEDKLLLPQPGGVDGRGGWVQAEDCGAAPRRIPPTPTRIPNPPLPHRTLNLPHPPTTLPTPPHCINTAPHPMHPTPTPPWSCLL